jgi:hypothetical protein
MMLRVVLETSDEGGFTVYAPSLPGCASEGDTEEGTSKNPGSHRPSFRARVNFMKDKISVRLDAEILRLAKRKAAEEDRSLSDLVRDALAKYLSRDAATPEERQKAFQLFCEQPMRLSGGQLRRVLQEDVWDT